MQKRNGNIEAFRIILMLGVIAFHILHYGNIFERADGPTTTILWLIKSFANLSVNCFVLITGYFQCQSTFKPRKLMALVTQVFFWSVVCYAAYLLAGGQLQRKGLVQTLLPWLIGGNWFAIVYIALYLISPFLNIFLRALDRRQATALLVLLIALFCTPMYAEQLALQPLGFPWFLVVYFVGAYLRLYPPRRRPALWAALLLLSVAGLWLLRLIPMPGWEKIPEYLWNYNSYLPLCGAVAAFLLFLWRRERMYPRWVFRLAGVTFGIYLIHDNYFFQNVIWAQGLIALLPAQITLREIWIFPATLAVIFIACGALEYGRQALFRALRMEKLEAKIADAAQRGYDKFCGLLR